MVDAGAYTHLRFLSTYTHSRYLSIPGAEENKDIKQVSDKYVYFSSAGEGVTVYIVEGGANPQHEEFAGVKIDWLFPVKSLKTKADQQFDSHGTCICSLVGGRNSGVSKKVGMVLIKNSESAGSTLDGLSLMIMDLRAREKRGETVKGYTVLNLSMVLIGPYPQNVSVLRRRLITLITLYKVVVVVSAGNDPVRQFASIIEWPARFSSELDIIVVGSVAPEPDLGLQIEERYPFSRGGRFLTAQAPGKVVCARNSVIQKPYSIEYGTSSSAAILSGLVAGYLASPAGDMLREQPDFSASVRDYIIYKSQSRRGSRKPDDYSVTNGLNANNPGEDGLYGWTLL